jgi:hypothetical protein
LATQFFQSPYWQLDLVAPVLDGIDILGVTATSDGKTTIFGIPILILLEMNQNPNEYPDLPRETDWDCRDTKGLSGNIVSTGKLVMLQQVLTTWFYRSTS